MNKGGAKYPLLSLKKESTFYTTLITKLLGKKNTQLEDNKMLLVKWGTNRDFRN